jgi:hypothetical protein
MIHLNQAGFVPESQAVCMEVDPKNPPVESISRPEAIERLRNVFAAASDEEQCACVIAGRYGIFCGGFAGLSDKEFRERFSWIVRKRPGASREELEQLASLYHLGRQQVTGTAVCCDVETRDHCGCDGWNMFDSRTLERFCSELTGAAVHVVEYPPGEKSKRPQV